MMLKPPLFLTNSPVILILTGQQAKRIGLSKVSVVHHRRKSREELAGKAGGSYSCGCQRQRPPLFNSNQSKNELWH
jgi:hypothetical protein